MSAADLTGGSFENIQFEIRDRVALITFNRPDRLNSLSHGLYRELTSVLTTIDDDPEIRCVVITGSGRAFSSGGDMSRKNRPEDAYSWYLWHEYKYGRDATPDIRGMHKPVIAAINGICYGAGMIFATKCDFRIAAASARFCMIEARMGNGGGGYLPFIVGAQWAKFLMLTGEVIDASAALRMGFVMDVTQDDELVDRAMALANRIAQMPPIGVYLNKRQIDGAVDMMGWAANDTFNKSHQAVVDSAARLATAGDGRLLREILDNEGLAAFKAARDQPFAEPWLRSPESP